MHGQECPGWIINSKFLCSSFRCYDFLFGSLVFNRKLIWCRNVKCNSLSWVLRLLLAKYPTKKPTCSPRFWTWDDINHIIHINFELLSSGNTNWDCHSICLGKEIGWFIRSACQILQLVYAQSASTWRIWWKSPLCSFMLWGSNWRFVAVCACRYCSEVYISSLCIWRIHSRK